MPVPAGRLNRRVVLQTATRAADTGGGGVDTWADTAEIWARVEPLAGDERFDAQQIASFATHRVTIRNRAVTPQQRIKYGTRILPIEAVLHDERTESIALLCSEEHI